MTDATGQVSELAANLLTLEAAARDVRRAAGNVAFTVDTEAIFGEGWEHGHAAATRDFSARLHAANPAEVLRRIAGHLEATTPARGRIPESDRVVHFRLIALCYDLADRCVSHPDGTFTYLDLQHAVANTRDTQPPPSRLACCGDPCSTG